MAHFSPLLWLCAVSAAALNSFTALDPTGVYGDYLNRLGADTPAVAAFFTAAQSGVFPWTVPEVPVIEPEVPEAPSEPKAPETPAEPVSPFTTVDESYFDDALFLGDSHTAGFHDYAGLRNATYFTKNGLTVWDATEKHFIELDGKKYTLAEALGTRQFGKIYVMLGINELGAGTTESWAAQYKVVLDTLRQTQPNAIIFIQSMFHTTQEKSESSYFKNDVINARNAAIAQLADNETVFYLSVNTVFDDETGALRSDYSGDGIHVRAPYYVEWRDYLYQFGVVRGTGSSVQTAPPDDTSSGDTDGDTAAVPVVSSETVSLPVESMLPGAAASQ